MSATEVYSLRWRDFESHLGGAFQALREDKDFCDVTLSCEGEHQIKAHKVVLSACSPFFQKILLRNHHPHPLLYLRGISHNILTSVVDFIYRGEARVQQDDLEEFLAIAKELDLKGLNPTQSKLPKNLDEIMDMGEVQNGVKTIEIKNEKDNVRDQHQEEIQMMRPRSATEETLSKLWQTLESNDQQSAQKEIYQISNEHIKNVDDLLQNEDSLDKEMLAQMVERMETGKYEEHIYWWNKSYQHCGKQFAPVVFTW